MRPSPRHLAYSDKSAIRSSKIFNKRSSLAHTEQRSQALSSLKESGSLDGIVMTGIHRHINKRFLESVEPSASWRICRFCSHCCGWFLVKLLAQDPESKLWG